jgi:hypothetical protein
MSAGQEAADLAGERSPGQWLLPGSEANVV